jgi:LmbE family N-acetylglucosaminyl deacetylase
LLPVLLPEIAPAQSGIVAARPDDEYAFAAATYRLAREAGWVADQFVIANGESGYRYITLAGRLCGVPLAPTSEGRERLAAIRKREGRKNARSASGSLL